jgi:dolichol-phosphate mannosyltransferase
MIILLLPAYNEEASLPVLLPKIDQTLRAAGCDYMIIVCNDGSKDQTGKMLQEYQQQFPLEIVTHQRNRGLGETSRDLFERAAEICKPDDVIVRMDCDDTHEPKHILELVGKINDGYDVAIASRFQAGGGQLGVSRYRAFISYCANLFMKVIFPVRGIREYSCGFRAYRASLIQQAIEAYGNNFIQLKGLGFTCTLEKLIKLNLMGAQFGEVPFVLRYDNKRSDSKMVSSITTLGYLVMVICQYWPWYGWRRQYKGKFIYRRPEPTMMTSGQQEDPGLKKVA